MQKAHVRDEHGLFSIDLCSLVSRMHANQGLENGL